MALLWVASVLRLWRKLPVRLTYRDLNVVSLLLYIKIKYKLICYGK